MSLYVSFKNTLINKKKLSKWSSKNNTLFSIISGSHSNRIINATMFSLFSDKKNFNNMTSLCLGDFSYKRIVNLVGTNRHFCQKILLNQNIFFLKKSS